MAHNIDMSNGRANIAFLGSRNDVWHKLGHEMIPGMTMDQWLAAAGLNWEAEKVLAWAGNQPSDIVEADAFKFIQRNDTKHVLGVASDRYCIHQPRSIVEWFQRYVGVDGRFGVDTLMALKKGALICGTALFKDDLTVAGDKHVARLLMSTTFDGTGSTINKGTMVRVVCNNTLDAALAVPGCEVRTRHNTQFNADKVSRELETIVQSFHAFKNMGDAMARVTVDQDKTIKFFKTLLDIPFETKKEDLSTRKLNQYEDMWRAYRTTATETDTGTAWTALNAVTRYVDHNRSTRGGDPGEGRFLSAQFGSGAQMKAQAVEVLCEMGELHFADFQKAMGSTKSMAGTDDVSAMLRSATRPH
jgi:phage/plasmid-like protein (TIGR03299 family)